MAIQALYKKGDAIYVELFDELHHIADPETLTAVFGASPIITHDDPPYPNGFPINSGSFLMRDGAPVYLMTNDKKYHIANPSSLEHFQLNGAILGGGDCQKIAAFAAKVVPSGPVIEE